MFLVAANNARRNAELLVNFELARVQATLSIDGDSGGSLSSAVIVGDVSETVTAVGVTSPVTAGTYTRIGIYNGHPIYVNNNSTMLLFFSAVEGEYLLAAALAEGDNYLSAGGATATGSFVHNGTTTGTAVLTAGAAGLWNGIKEVTAIMRQRPDGTYIPLDFASVAVPIERDRSELEFQDCTMPYLRYPSDAQLLARGSNSSIVQRRGTLFVYPHFTNQATYSIDSLLEAFAWLPDYDATTLANTTYEDFLMKFGADYLQWAIICELNFIFQTFVPRTEGAITAPEQAKNDALQRLIEWNAYMVDGNMTRSA